MSYTQSTNSHDIPSRRPRNPQPSPNVQQTIQGVDQYNAYLRHLQQRRSYQPTGNAQSSSDQRTEGYQATANYPTNNGHQPSDSVQRRDGNQSSTNYQPWSAYQSLAGYNAATANPFNSANQPDTTYPPREGYQPSNAYQQEHTHQPNNTYPPRDGYRPSNVYQQEHTHQQGHGRHQGYRRDSQQPPGRQSQSYTQDGLAYDSQHARARATAQYLDNWEEHWMDMGSNGRNGQGRPRS